MQFETILANGATKVFPTFIRARNFARKAAGTVQRVRPMHPGDLIIARYRPTLGAMSLYSTTIKRWQRNGFWAHNGYDKHMGRYLYWN